MEKLNYLMVGCPKYKEDNSGKKILKKCLIALCLIISVLIVAGVSIWTTNSTTNTMPNGNAYAKS
jgi:hypothetical protein